MYKSSLWCTTPTGICKCFKCSIKGCARAAVVIQVVQFEVLLGAEAVREGTEEWTDGVFLWQHSWDVLGTITV